MFHNYQVPPPAPPPSLPPAPPPPAPIRRICQNTRGSPKFQLVCRFANFQHYFILMFLQEFSRERDEAIDQINNRAASFNSTINGSYRAVNPRSLFEHSTQVDERNEQELPDLSPVRRRSRSSPAPFQDSADQVENTNDQSTNQLRTRPPGINHCYIQVHLPFQKPGHRCALVENPGDGIVQISVKISGGRGSRLSRQNTQGGHLLFFPFTSLGSFVYPPPSHPHPPVCISELGKGRQNNVQPKILNFFNLLSNLIEVPASFNCLKLKWLIFTNAC